MANPSPIFDTEYRSLRLNHPEMADGNLLRANDAIAYFEYFWQNVVKSEGSSNKEGIRK
jgi:hypothetical protein